MLWEDALTALASSTQTGSVTNRSAVAGSGAPSWISTWSGKLVSSTKTNWDLWWAKEFTVGYRTYWYMAGANFNNKDMSDGNGPLTAFNAQSGNILTPLASPSPQQNDLVSAASLGAGVMALANIDSWLTGWMPKINGWADAIGDTGSDWEGSAAAAFKWTLVQFAGELANLHAQLNTPANRFSDLYLSAMQLDITPYTLQNAYNAWWESPDCNPITCMVSVLDSVMATAQWTTKVTDSPGRYSTQSLTVQCNVPYYGYPDTQSFWTAIDSSAKTLWLNNIASVLDAAATPAMTKLSNLYQSTINQLGNLVQISLEAPPEDNTGVNGGDGGGSGDPNLNTGDPNLNTGDPNITPGGSSSGGGGNLDLGGNTNTSGDPNTADIPNVVPGGSSSGGTGNLGANTGDGTNTNVPDPVLTTGGSSSGGSDDEPSEDTITGPNGSTLDDSAGDPIEVPAGSTISSDGEVIGPNGSPVLGANGQPLTVPKGSTIGQSNGAAGNVVVPQGSKINTNGTVTGPDGKEVLDSNGNPLVLAKGSTIAADGTVLGPGGKTVPLSTQLLTDQEQALSNPDTTGATSVAALQSSVPTVGGAQAGGASMGLSQSALDQGASLPDTSAAGTGTGTSTTSSDDGLASALDSSAAGTGSSSGTSSTTSSGEEMPMMPGGMGGGGMGQQGGQDRQRTTWLAEEEEVWGTDIDAVSGTIGR